MIQGKLPDAATSVYGVIGDPISHSLSPVMHNAAFSHIGYNGVYLAFQVRDVETAILGMRALGIRGLSVTIPHKVGVMAFLDSIDDIARKIGAVNTVVSRDGTLTGYNSDCLGAIRALSEKTAIQGKDVGIIGAGGAARAIGFGICAEGGKLTIVNRSPDKGEMLAKELDADFLPLSDLDRLRCQILINTTSLGMTPNTQTTPVSKKYLEKDMVIMDIVYNPLKTLLLRDAESLGCTIVDGVEMFVYQGAFQFEQWTGEKAPVAVMRKAVLDSLK